MMQKEGRKGDKLAHIWDGALRAATSLPLFDFSLHILFVVNDMG